MNQCGTCTLCCKLLGVTELKKAPGKWCQHCAPGVGCKIYETRPPTCSWFECGWLLSDLPEQYRPDHLHFLVTGETKFRAILVHCDPHYPGATHTKDGERFLASLAKNGQSVILITGDKRTLLSGNIVDLEYVHAIAMKGEFGEGE